MTDPHDREYHAAAASIHEQTPSRSRFAAGDTVRCPRAFADGYQVGRVIGRATQRHRDGEWYHVDTQQGPLLCLADELERI